MWEKIILGILGILPSFISKLLEAKMSKYLASISVEVLSTTYYEGIVSTGT